MRHVLRFMLAGGLLAFAGVSSADDGRYDRRDDDRRDRRVEGRSDDRKDSRQQDDSADRWNDRGDRDAARRDSRWDRRNDARDDARWDRRARRDDRIENRLGRVEGRHEFRMRRGMRHGEITRGERLHYRAIHGRIHAMHRRASQDGRLSVRERIAIRRALLRERMMIGRFNHNEGSN